MAKEEKKVAPAVDNFGDFEFINPLKYQRAVDNLGSADDKGALLAEYDRLGGFIRYQGSKVIQGAFWDRKRNVRIEDPMPKVLRRQAAFVEETIEEVVADVPKSRRGRKADAEDETE